MRRAFVSVCVVACCGILFAGKWVLGEVRVTSSTRQVIDSFNDAFNRHDMDALAELLTDDTVFEDTSPAPDGRRIEGKADVVAFWRGWFERNADARFDAEEILHALTRCTE